MKQQLFAVAAACVLASASFCGGARAQAPEVDTLRVGLIGIADNIPVYVAEKQGYFKQEGLTVATTVFPGGAAAQPALFAGKIDILHTNLVSLLLAKAQGFDLVQISSNSVAQAQPPDAGQLVVKADSAIRSAKDLEGKRVAVNNLNNIIWLAVRSLIEKQGADPRKAVFQEVPFPQMLDALLNDRVDAIVSVEPFSTIAAGTGKTRVAGYYYIEIQPSLELAGMVAMKSWVDKHPAATRAFVRAFRRGIAEMTSSPAATQAALVEFAKMKPELAAKVQLNVLTTKSDPRSIQTWENLMLKSGLLKQPVGAASLLYATALE